MARVGPAVAELATAADPSSGLVGGARLFLVELVDEVRGDREASRSSTATRCCTWTTSTPRSRSRSSDWSGSRLPLHVVSSGLVLPRPPPAPRRWTLTCATAGGLHRPDGDRPPPRSRRRLEEGRGRRLRVDSRGAPRGPDVRALPRSDVGHPAQSWPRCTAIAQASASRSPGTEGDVGATVHDVAERFSARMADGRARRARRARRGRRRRRLSPTAASTVPGSCHETIRRVGRSTTTSEGVGCPRALALSRPMMWCPPASWTEATATLLDFAAAGDDPPRTTTTSPNDPRGTSVSDLPESANVVVIGAGIVGNSVIGHLAKLGWRDIVQIDKGPLPNPGGSTGHASNFIFPVNHEQGDGDADAGQPAPVHRDGGLNVACGGVEIAREPQDGWRSSAGG